MPTNEPRPTKAVRRDEARAKALQLRKEQERKARRNRILAIGALAVTVLGLVAVVFFIVKQDAANKAANSNISYGQGVENVVPPTLADVEAPAGAQDNGGIPVSDDGVGETGDGDTVVSIYFDFMCPVCGQFEQVNAEDVDTLIEDGDVTVAFHPLSFLDGQSKGTSYSTRAANAYAVVADQAPDQLNAFMTAMYAPETQPAENSEGLTDAEIREVAIGVGVPEDVADAFSDTVDGTFTTTDSDEEQDGTWRTFAPWVMAATNQAGADLEKLQTPTILIDGELWTGDWAQPGNLKLAVEEAKAAKS